MCPLCIISAIVLASSAGTAGGINWLAIKHREKNEKAGDAKIQGLRLGDYCIAGGPAEAACEGIEKKAAS
jgi:hypothetical protein